MQKILSLLLVLLHYGSIALAQPVNDNCSGAITVVSGATCSPVSGTAQAAMALPANPCIANKPDVWYKFVATTTMQSISVGGGPVFDAVISVYSG